MPATSTFANRLTPASAFAMLLGFGLFAYTVRRTGLESIVDGLLRVGWGFVPVFGLSGFRFFVRARAWRLCTQDPARLSTRRAFGSVLLGDAAGSLTPFGLVASESAKLWLSRGRLSLLDALSSIALENLFYTLTVALVIGGGCVALLLAVDPLPRLLQLLAGIGVAAMALISLSTAFVLVANIPLLTPWLRRLERKQWLSERLRHRVGDLEAFEARVLQFARSHRTRLVPILCWEGLFHVAGVLEVLVVVSLLTDRPPELLGAFILEAVNRFITVAFKFVPLRLGVDEAGTGLLTGVLGLGSALGVTLAIVRKIRVLGWNAVGVLVLVWRQIATDDSARRAV